MKTTFATLALLWLSGYGDLGEAAAAVEELRLPLDLPVSFLRLLGYPKRADPEYAFLVPEAYIRFRRAAARRPRLLYDLA